LKSRCGEAGLRESLHHDGQRIRRCFFDEKARRAVVPGSVQGQRASYVGREGCGAAGGVAANLRWADEYIASRHPASRSLAQSSERGPHGSDAHMDWPSCSESVRPATGRTHAAAARCTSAALDLNMPSAAKRGSWAAGHLPIGTAQALAPPCRGETPIRLAVVIAVFGGRAASSHGGPVHVARSR